MSYSSVYARNVDPPMPNHSGVPKINHFVLIFPSRQAASMLDRNSSSSVIGACACQLYPSFATYDNVVAQLMPTELEVARLLHAWQLLVEVRGVQGTSEEERGERISQRQLETQ